MIESVVALLMFVNGEIKEARLQPTMAICLRGKREAERTFSESVTYKCWKGKVTTKMPFYTSSCYKFFYYLFYVG